MTPDKSYISQSEIAQLEADTKTHFLNPNAVRSQKSLGDLTGITGFGFHIMDVAPGHATTEYHLHHFEDECLYVLEGTATARVGDASFTISAGDFLGFRKQGPPHTVINTGDTVFRYIVVGERKAQDVVDYPEAQKRLYRSAGLAPHLADLAP